MRSRGVRNGGNETYDPPFRGAIVIEQNYPVNASPAILERIMQLKFDKTGWSTATKIAAAKLEHWPIEPVSGFMTHIIRREAEFLKTFREAFLRHESEIERRGQVNNIRIVKNHAQLAAALDALAGMVEIPDEAHSETIERIYAMAAERRASLSADHDVVQRFWELFDYLEHREDNPTPDTCINRHRKPDEFIAVSLPQFEERCRSRGLIPPGEKDLKRHLKSSKSRRFLKADTVNMVNDRHAHCWIFERPRKSERKEK